MKSTEIERLIKSDILSIENRVRHAFNQGYDLGYKEGIEKKQSKTGHWEQYGNFWEEKFKCSECGKEQPKILCGERIIGHWSDYCPNCGCRMVEPQESEDKG